MAATDGQLVLYGVGSAYVHEVIESAARAGIPIAAFVDNLGSVNDARLEPLYAPDELSDVLLSTGMVIPLVTPGYRKAMEAELRELGATNYADLVDPTAVIASSTEHGKGFQVNAGVVIGANCRFGRQVQINRSASIGHDATIGDYVSFGPGCVLCGGVRIDAGTFVGGGATIAPDVHIGRNAIVGAGAVVIRDVPDGTVVAGNPATVLREDIQGYNGAAV